MTKTCGKVGPEYEDQKLLDEEMAVSVDEEVAKIKNQAASQVWIRIESLELIYMFTRDLFKLKLLFNLKEKKMRMS